MTYNDQPVARSPDARERDGEHAGLLWSMVTTVARHCSRMWPLHLLQKKHLRLQVMILTTSLNEFREVALQRVQPTHWRQQ